MTTSHALTAIPIAVAGTLLLGAGAANGLTLALDNLSTPGGYDLTIVDNGIGDSNSELGVVTYTGKLGTWTITNAGGTGMPVMDNWNLDLSTSTTSSKAGAVLISLWDTFSATGAPHTFSTSIGGTLNQAGQSLSVTYYQSAASTEHAASFYTSATETFSRPTTGTPSGFNSPTALSLTNSAPAGNSFNLGIDITLTATKAGRISSSSDGMVTPVPIPAAAVLFGSGLLGMIGLGRRRSDQTQLLA